MTPTVTMIVKFAGDSGGVTVRLMKSEPMTVFITPTKTRNDLLIRCSGMQNNINMWLEQGETVDSIGVDLITAKEEEPTPVWQYKDRLYHGFKDVIGKCLIACNEELNKERRAPANKEE